MTKRILSAMMIVLLLCSCAAGATWSGFWQETKDFFGTCVERVKNWLNNSDSKKLDKLTEDVTELRLEVSSIREGVILLAGNTPSIVAVSGQKKAASDDLRKRENELSKREQAIASQEAALSSREEHLRREEQKLLELKHDVESRLASREAELSLREQELNKESERVAAFKRKQEEAKQKAAKIHSRLKADKYLGKFIEAGMFCKIDVERFMLYDKSYGAIEITGTPFGTLTANLDTEKFGFMDTDTLRNALKSLFRDNAISIRGDAAVVLVRSDDKSSWNRQINSVSGSAFFNLEGLTAELNSLPQTQDTSESEITAFLNVNELNGKLRIFFRTRHEGLYVMALMDNENTAPMIYLAANVSHKLINRRDLPRTLRSRTELLNSGQEAALYFEQEDSKIDVYLDRFIRSLVEKVPSYKDR